MSGLPPMKAWDSPRPSLARTSGSQSAYSPRLDSERSVDIREDLASGGDDHDDDWGWRLRGKAVRPVPSFYPIDPRSSRRVALSSGEAGGDGGDEEMNTAEDDTRQQSIEAVTRKISRACQSLSIYAIWDNNSPSAKLSSMERVEMEITVYSGDGAAGSSQRQSPQVLLVELQKMKGCSVTFHNYRRCLLDAAEGKFDAASYQQRDGLDKPGGRDRTNQPRASLGRPGLARPSLSRGLGSSPSSPPRPSLSRPTYSPPTSPTDSSMPRPSNIARPSLSRPGIIAPSSPAGFKTEGECMTTAEIDVQNTIVDKALEALNMAATLIKKDRVDAQRIGLESLVLLTDPLRAGMETAKIASRVVLLGSASEDDVGLDTNDVDTLFDESAGLGIRETILEMIMSDNNSKKMSSDDHMCDGIEKEHSDGLFNLCLTVLSNALHTIEESFKMGLTPSGQSNAPPSNYVEHSSEGENKSSLFDSPGNSPSFSRPSGVPKRFIDDTSSTFGIDVLSSLIGILGQAKTNPHDAYHSARCLGVLFKGCGNSHKARARRDLDAKRIISAALEVGSRSHAKLEDASRVAMMALVTDDEESVEEAEEGQNTEMENEILDEVDEAQQHEDLPCAMEQSMSADNEDR